jgi:hypothetical protein
MIELTEQQVRELQQAGWPPEAKNPATGQTFVLIHRELFERVRTKLEEEDEIEAIEEMYPLVGEVLNAEEEESPESAGQAIRSTDSSSRRTN